jgi:hypothetical protein
MRLPWNWTLCPARSVRWVWQWDDDLCVCWQPEEVSELMEEDDEPMPAPAEPAPAGC